MPGLPENQEVTFDEELATVQEPRKRLRVGCGAGASRAVPDRFPAPTLRAEWPSPGGACEKEPLGTPLPPPHLPSKTGPVLWKGYRPTSGWERQLPREVTLSALPKKILPPSSNYIMDPLKTMVKTQL